MHLLYLWVHVLSSTSNWLSVVYSRLDDITVQTSLTQFVINNNIVCVQSANLWIIFATFKLRYNNTGIGKRKSSRGGKSSTRKDGIWIMSLSSILKKHRPMVLVLILLLLLTSVSIPWPICEFSLYKNSTKHFSSCPWFVPTPKLYPCKWMHASSM